MVRAVKVIRATRDEFGEPPDEGGQLATRVEREGRGRGVTRVGVRARVRGVVRGSGGGLEREVLL